MLWLSVLATIVAVGVIVAAMPPMVMLVVMVVMMALFVVNSEGFSLSVNLFAIMQ